jgi:regulatory protein
MAGRRHSGGDHDVPPEDPQTQEPPSDPEAVARAICLRLLTQRARSRSELETALRKRGLPDDAAARVLDRFCEVGLIDDQALAASMAAAAHAERGLASRAIATKLRQRGIDDADVASAVAPIDTDSEREQARRLVAKRLPALRGLEPQVQARRLVGLLARKGYPSGLAYDIVRATLSESGPDLGAAPGEFGRG